MKNDNVVLKISGFVVDKGLDRVFFYYSSCFIRRLKHCCYRNVTKRSSVLFV